MNINFNRLISYNHMMDNSILGNHKWSLPSVPRWFNFTIVEVTVWKNDIKQKIMERNYLSMPYQTETVFIKYDFREVMVDVIKIYNSIGFTAYWDKCVYTKLGFLTCWALYWLVEIVHWVMDSISFTAARPLIARFMVLSAPVGPHVDPMNLDIWVVTLAPPIRVY